MMKHEFCEKANIREDDILQSEYELIEFVYARHPAFNGSNPKQKAAALYNLMGIGVFKSMKADAEKAEKIEQEVLSITNQIAELEKKKRELLKQYNEMA